MAYHQEVISPTSCHIVARCIKAPTTFGGGFGFLTPISKKKGLQSLTVQKPQQEPLNIVLLPRKLSLQQFPEPLGAIISLVKC